ncbi:MAG: DUF488 domain-containing protein [Pseudomonadota bacterium]|nr:DUF488 domain-containing protein [Pseudomonadota bacterium]
MKRKAPMITRNAVYTIGHSTHPIAEFTAILQNVGVDFVVDVRTIPRSRTNPQFNFDTLPQSLRKAKIGYTHIAELGGLRARQKQVHESPNTFWENKSFRNYADYALTDDFRKGLDELEALAAKQVCALMCAEAVWWRCHRRIIADYLLMEGYPVMHIMGIDRIEPARMTEAAMQAGERMLRYEA